MYVIITCVLEMVWVFGFSTADSLWQWILLAGVIIVDFYFLSKACEGLPTGTVYAVFAGAGSIGTVVMDSFLFGGTMNMVTLLFIGLLVAGVVGLKLFSRDKNIRNGALFAGGFALSFGLLYQAFGYLQLSIAYAVWIGIGTAGAVLINMIFFGESKSASRIASLILIIIGVTGLKLVS
nr:SMR family transporter [Paenibacillus sp. CECT 9249]